MKVAALAPWILFACAAACVDGQSPAIADADTAPAGDSSVDTTDPIDISVRCPGGCTALDGPCMRGVCGDFGCDQVRISGLACDDGLACTSGDRCELGMCRGEASTCSPGVDCGEFFCPGADALCVAGQCVRCSMPLVDADCESPRFPRLSCPNMPGGVRVVARLLGRLVTSGPVVQVRLGLSWADSSWGDSASGWCEVTGDHPEGVPTGCGFSFNSERPGFEPDLEHTRLMFSTGPVGAFVSNSATAPHPADGPVCNSLRLGGAILSIAVEP